MPKSKTSPRRAKKLQARSRRTARRQDGVSYAELLDALRASFNERFYSERGFPHLEILSKNFSGTVTHGDLSDYLQLLEMMVSFGFSLSEALSRRAPLTIEEREDRVAAVAYALAATVLNIRPDFLDDSQWMGGGVIDALRERWGAPKMKQAGIDMRNLFMDPRELASYFAMDFVMSWLDMTGEIAEMGSDRLVSVTACKDALVTRFTGFITSNLRMRSTVLPDLETIFKDNAATEGFRSEYPDWQPEPADAFDPRWAGFHGLAGEDKAFLESLFTDEKFMNDMEVLYASEAAGSMPQGKREEVVMGYVLQRGPRCKKAFAEGRDPTEEEMDRDAEVVNNLVMTMMSARTVMLPEAPEEGAPVPASVTEALDEAARKDA